jgi:hypothetical protein
MADYKSINSYSHDIKRRETLNKLFDTQPFSKNDIEEVFDYFNNSGLSDEEIYQSTETILNSAREKAISPKDALLRFFANEATNRFTPKEHF